MRRIKHTDICDPFEYLIAMLIDGSTLRLVTDDPEIAPLFNQIKRILFSRVDNTSKYDCIDDDFDVKCVTTYYEIIKD